MKTCFKCGQEKPLTEYYAHKGMKDGHLNKCKECTKLDVRTNREKNVEYYREFDRVRGKRGRSVRKSGQAAANSAVARAVKSGALVRPDNCEECGENHSYIHAHHADYDNKLDVGWLCPPCHAIADGRKL